MKQLDYGKNYQYAHDFEGNFVNIEFLPDDVAGTAFYQPNNNAAEDKIRASIHKNWGDKYQKK
jgi:putative ATPase